MLDQHEYTRESEKEKGVVRTHDLPNCYQVMRCMANREDARCRYGTSHYLPPWWGKQAGSLLERRRSIVLGGVATTSCMNINEDACQTIQEGWLVL